MRRPSWCHTYVDWEIKNRIWSLAARGESIERILDLIADDMRAPRDRETVKKVVEELKNIPAGIARLTMPEVQAFIVDVSPDLAVKLELQRQVGRAQQEAEINHQNDLIALAGRLRDDLYVPHPLRSLEGDRPEISCAVEEEKNMALLLEGFWSHLVTSGHDDLLEHYEQWKQGCACYHEACNAFLSAIQTEMASNVPWPVLADYKTVGLTPWFGATILLDALAYGESGGQRGLWEEEYTREQASEGVTLLREGPYIIAMGSQAELDAMEQCHRDLREQYKGETGTPYLNTIAERGTDLSHLHTAINDALNRLILTGYIGGVCELCP